jgi:UDP-N-acetylglucosamine diphosphorylase/glucosamine-1-phosphate N-acetyltransferase
MNIVFYDPGFRENLLPLTATRPAADLRVGILTIREKWLHDLGETTSSTHTAAYLSGTYPYKKSKTEVWISSTICPTPEMAAAARALKAGDLLHAGTVHIAQCQSESAGDKVNQVPAGSMELVEILRPFDIFKNNGTEIKRDFERLTKGKKSQPVSATNTIIGPKDQLFLAPGAKVEASVINTTDGPVYIGPDAEVMEGCLIRGPFALCDHAVLKMGTKVYGATTIGPGCKVGGEVNNVVFFANSNKAHDGFLGNAVIGEWCNLGADSNCSNLKNNYGEVSLYNYHTHKAEKTGLQFCGLIMGDHAKCGINTMFNTGTVVGVCANVFGAGFPDTFVPDFSWGGKDGMTTYDFDKACETIERVYARRGRKLDANEREVLKAIFNQTAPLRR